ncbi:NeuD/PglB/VioB family sugar acetyltransferase [Actinokineospora soli]|uniref:NeuD/PglB/VioB family sugar acetyltransferase n=1 Tax=Actinokineospora soli TaxID=1048753 RepID=A0ABW2TZ76_9PSEU
MTRPLLLVGAGGLAREVLAAARAADVPVRGMLDDDPARHGATVDGVPVLGGLDEVHNHPDAQVLLCVANPARPAGRAKVVARLGLPDERYATLVHPTASIARGTELGAGTILLAHVVITAPQRVGKHVLAMPQVLLTHDDVVHDGATLAGRVALAGGVTVGESAYLGAGALVRQGVHIGPEAVVGMGAVVLADVPAGRSGRGTPPHA